jgi:hypothetical protein
MACSGFAPYSYHPCRANKKLKTVLTVFIILMQHFWG